MISMHFHSVFGQGQGRKQVSGSEKSMIFCHTQVTNSSFKSDAIFCKLKQHITLDNITHDESLSQKSNEDNFFFSQFVKKFKYLYAMCMFQTESEVAIVPLSYKRGNEIKLTSLWVSSCDIQLHAKPLYNQRWRCTMEGQQNNANLQLWGKAS